VRYLRDLSVLQVAPDRVGLVDAADEELAELQAEAAALERSRVTQMFERMLRCCDELGKTLQPRLVLDCALIDAATTEPLIPLGDLIDRLTDLEARLAGRAARAGGGGGGAKDRPRPTPSAPSGTRPPATPSRSAAPSGPGSPRGLEEPGAPGAGNAGGVRPSVSMAPAASAPKAAPASDRPEPAGSAAEVASPVAVERSGPATTPSLQPSGPVPKPETVAAGSGPHDDARAQIAVPASDDDALRAWNSVLHELEARGKVSLFGPFQHARVMRWTSENLELGFPVDVESMGDMAKDNADELCAIVRTLGPELKAIKVTVRLLDASESRTTGARSILETSRERSSAERSRREAEAREHPITKHVLQTFGAQIKEIKTDV
jgi:hypothetical protein